MPVTSLQFHIAAKHQCPAAGHVVNLVTFSSNIFAICEMLLKENGQSCSEYSWYCAIEEGGYLDSVGMYGEIVLFNHCLLYTSDAADE